MLIKKNSNSWKTPSDYHFCYNVLLLLTLNILLVLTFVNRIGIGNIRDFYRDIKVTEEAFRLGLTLLGMMKVTFYQIQYKSLKYGRDTFKDGEDCCRARCDQWVS